MSLEQYLTPLIYDMDPPSNTGWRAVLCQVCHDHGRKGKRAGFRFVDANTVEYHCFNCGFNVHINIAESRGIPDTRMLTLLEAFSIPSEPYRESLLAYADKDTIAIVEEDIPHLSIATKEVQMPSYFYRLQNDPTDSMAQFAIEYLKKERNIHYEDYPFFLARKDSSDAQSKKWLGRLIIPFYRDGKIVYFIGRDLLDIRHNKYKNVMTPRSALLSSYSFLTEKSPLPIYITEGWFDAYHLSGVCTFGTSITPEQAVILNQSSRPKIVIPDQYGNGGKLAKRAVQLGWGISTPDIGEVCKDVNDAIVKYGKLYTMKAIVDRTTFDPDQARVQIALWCK